MYAARKMAQMRAITPWSMLGGRGGRGGNCIAAIVVEEAVARACRVGGTKKFRRAGRGFVHSAGRLSVSALASRSVRPLGAASSYSRAVLGARGNVWPLGARRKGAAERKCRNLRTLNNQHFHSPLCILWITQAGPRAGSARAGSQSTHLGVGDLGEPPLSLSRYRASTSGGEERSRCAASPAT
jgi:hypothetical protein